MVDIVKLKQNDVEVIPEQAYSASNDTNGESLLMENILKTMYPIGSIYFTTSGTNPGATGGVFAGRGMTWVAFGAGRVPVGADSAHTVGATGGSTTHTITINELPAHSHGMSGAGGHNHATDFKGEGEVSIRGGYISWRSGYLDQRSDNCSQDNTGNGNWGKGLKVTSHAHDLSAVGDHTHTVSDTGGGKAMSIEQPWIGVYMWKRTA